MKKILFIISFAFLFAFSTDIHAQNGPPDPPNDHGDTNDNPPGGDAPIGGGLGILIGMAALYGGRKVYAYYQENKKELME